QAFDALNPDALEAQCFRHSLDLLRLITQPQCDVMTGALLAPGIHELVHGSGHPHTAVGIADIENVPRDRFRDRVDQFELETCRKLGQVYEGHPSVRDPEVDPE